MNEVRSLNVPNLAQLQQPQRVTLPVSIQFCLNVDITAGMTPQQGAQRVMQLQAAVQQLLTGAMPPDPED